MTLSIILSRIVQSSESVWVEGKKVVIKDNNLLLNNDEQHYPTSTKERIIILILYACLLVVIAILAFFAIKRGTARKAALAELTQANEVIIVTVNDNAYAEQQRDAESKEINESTTAITSAKPAILSAIEQR